MEVHMMSYRERWDNIFNKKEDKVMKAKIPPKEENPYDINIELDSLEEDIISEEDIIPEETYSPEKKSSTRFVENKSWRESSVSQEDFINFRKERLQKEQEELHQKYVHRTQEQQNSQSQEEKRKEVLIGFVIDGTYSFTTVFPKVFYIVKYLLEGLAEKKSEYPAIAIRYSLTVFHEKAEPINLGQNQVEFFTDSEFDFLEKLKKVNFYGGSKDGKEHLTEALDQAMCVLQNAGGKNAERGLFFFSDAEPENDNMNPDFTDEDQDGYINKGLRFAEIYTFSEKFMPRFKMVDGYGNDVGNGKNETKSASLESLLKGDLDDISKKIIDIVDELLRQVSVRMMY